MERIIDLHIHTTCSDGSLSPKQVVDEAEKNGVGVIAIADHDSVNAYTPDLFDYATKKGIKLLPAVEMSTKFNGVGVHVLGYNFDLKNQVMLETFSKLQNARQDYLFNVSDKLQELGYEVNLEKLKEAESVTKAHISQDVVSNPKNEELLLKNFGHIPSKGEFIETIMNEGCPAYTEKFSISPIEASRIIHEAGGKVVLAHPVAYKYEDNVSESQVLDLAKQMNADGIEANYLYVDRNDKMIDETEFWNDFAMRNNLFVTIGSDFHLDDGLRPKIGFVNTNFRLTETEIENILNSLK